MPFMTSAVEAYPQIETNATNRGNAETVHLLGTLEGVVRGGKRYRPFAGSVAYCPRENWFHGNMTKEAGAVLPATLNLYQGIGNGVEERIVAGMRGHGKLLGAQVKLPNPPKNFGIDVGGYIDAIGIDNTGKVAAYEIKTTGAMPTSPKAKHLAQAMTYACLGGIDNVYIVYVGRQVQAFPDPTPLLKVFHIDTHALMLEYMTTLVMSCHSLSSKSVPPRPATFRKSHECQYCDFAQMCWKDDIYPTMLPAVASEHYAEAEKTAAELMRFRPAFYIDLLENCSPGCPVTNTDRLMKEIESARDLNEKAKKGKK